VSEGRILIVDDDPHIRRVMRATLGAQGYEVADARVGEEALEKLQSETYDLILLDMNMPGMGGLETCRAIRAGRSSPDLAVIVLTVRNTERDKVEVLDAGADDYVTKPFSTPELLARIRAALRRMPLSSEDVGRRMNLSGEVEIDFEGRCVRMRGREAHLTPKEHDLLRYLVAHPNKVIPHRELLQAVWGVDYGEELEYLRVFVNQLRKKLEPDPSKPRYLLTEPWVGYRFCSSVCS
jgi:two-component system KDP operon response regulator KdpE